MGRWKDKHGRTPWPEHEPLVVGSVVCDEPGCGMKVQDLPGHKALFHAKRREEPKEPKTFTLAPGDRRIEEYEP